MPRFAIFASLGIILALLPSSSPAAEAPTGIEVSLSNRARQLLGAGQTEQAERMVRAALLAGDDDELLSLAGEIHFRRADFPEAIRDFQAALALNPDNARACWGLGRIEQALFHPQRARDLFSRAFTLDHRDIDVILAYADFVTDAESKAVLLANVAHLARLPQPERAERAVADLQIHQRLQGRLPSRLASPYAAYRLPLTGFRPTSSEQNGILVSARINGGKPLRLLFDTGAHGIVIHAQAARSLGLETIVASRLGGFGDTAASEARVALARTVTFGDLAFEECLIEVTAHSLTGGADGVMGADIFERFKIGVDAQARVLRLTPFDDAAASPASVPAIGIRHLLLVKTRVDGGKEGLFLVDTGAAFTAVSRDYLPLAAIQQARPVDMLGAQGSLSGAFRTGPLAFRMGGFPLMENAPLAMDLKAVSQLQGIEIAGILGYSTLAKSPFTLDLRNGTVELTPAGGR